MLAVSVHKNQDLALSYPGAGLDGGAVTLLVGVAQAADALGGADRGNVVRGGVIHHQDFRIGQDLAQARKQPTQGQGFVSARQDDAEFGGHGYLGGC